MDRPTYPGNCTYIPSTVDTKGYFLQTVVADWGLSDFLLTGQTKDVFLTGLQELVDFKAISRDVRAFAKALMTFYSVEQTLAVAMNYAEDLLNRRALKGFEQVFQ